jgi:hypothetical protein
MGVWCLEPPRRRRIRPFVAGPRSEESLALSGAGPALISGSPENGRQAYLLATIRHPPRRPRAEMRRQCRRVETRHHDIRGVPDPAGRSTPGSARRRQEWSAAQGRAGKNHILIAPDAGPSHCCHTRLHAVAHDRPRRAGQSASAQTGAGDRRQGLELRPPPGPLRGRAPAGGYCCLVSRYLCGYLQRYLLDTPTGSGSCDVVPKGVGRQST